MREQQILVMVRVTLGMERVKGSRQWMREMCKESQGTMCLWDKETKEVTESVPKIALK